jgi:DNA-binding HxlR family transcriptional regulator
MEREPQRAAIGRSAEQEGLVTDLIRPIYFHHGSHPWHLGGLMHRKCFKAMPCPIARSLEMVGEWWSILILRDAYRGMTRFDEFQKNLDTSTNTLTRRLNSLVEQGLLERRPYCEKPVRHEYVLTAAGRDFEPVLQAFTAWGSMHATPAQGRPEPPPPTAN